MRALPLGASIPRHAGGATAFGWTGARAVSVAKADIRVLIVDDHALVRRGLRSILEAGALQVVGEAASAEEALSRAEETEPDVVLMDLSMPGIGGLNGTAMLKARMPDVAVIVVTLNEDVAYMGQSFDRGAAGYITKDAAEMELARAVRLVAAGQQYVQRSLKDT